MNRSHACAAWLPSDAVMGEGSFVVSHESRQAEDLYCGGSRFTPMLRRYRPALLLAAGGDDHVGADVWAGAGAPPPPEDAVGLRGFTIDARGLPPGVVLDSATGVATTRVPAG